MKKKRLARFLCLVFLLNICLPIMAYADSNKISDLKAYAGDIFDEDLLLNNSTISEIESYLFSKYPQKTTNNKYVLNPYVYQKYKEIAYTDQKAVDNKIAGLSSKGTPKKETQIKDANSKRIEIDEYRYLGYKVDGLTIITNDFYPADSKVVSNATDRNYVFTDPRRTSWSTKVLDNKEMLYYYLKTPVLNDDKETDIFEQQEYSIAEMVKEHDTSRATKFPTVIGDIKKDVKLPVGIDSYNWKDYLY